MPVFNCKYIKKDKSIFYNLEDRSEVCLSEFLYNKSLRNIALLSSNKAILWISERYTESCNDSELNVLWVRIVKTMTESLFNIDIPFKIIKGNIPNHGRKNSLGFDLYTIPFSIILFASQLYRYSYERPQLCLICLRKLGFEGNTMKDLRKWKTPNKSNKNLYIESLLQTHKNTYYNEHTIIDSREINNIFMSKHSNESLLDYINKAIIEIKTNGSTLYEIIKKKEPLISFNRVILNIL